MPMRTYIHTFIQTNQQTHALTYMHTSKHPYIDTNIDTPSRSGDKAGCIHRDAIPSKGSGNPGFGLHLQLSSLEPWRPVPYVNCTVPVKRL